MKSFLATLAFIAGVFLVPQGANAATLVNYGTFSLTTGSPTVVINPRPDTGSCSLLISGSFSGTVAWNGGPDGTHYFGIAGTSWTGTGGLSSVTSANQVIVPCGIASYFEVTVSPFVSGTVSVTIYGIPNASNAGGSLSGGTVTVANTAQVEASGAVSTSLCDITTAHVCAAFGLVNPGIHANVNGTAWCPVTSGTHYLYAAEFTNEQAATATFIGEYDAASVALGTPTGLLQEIEIPATFPGYFVIPSVLGEKHSTGICFVATTTTQTTGTPTGSANGVMGAAYYR